jgi:hypothetical protein
MIASLMIAAGLTLAPQAAPPGPGTAPFAASCKVAAVNMQNRVRPETEDFARYGEQAAYWDGELHRLEAVEATRVSLETAIKAELDGAVARVGYMDGMMMVGQHLAMCRQAREAS